MHTKIRLVVLIALFQLSCAEIVDKPFIAARNNILPITPTPERIPDPSKFEPRDGEKMVIYWGALTRVFFDGKYDNILGSINRGYLIYRIEAVSPQGIEQIENNQDIPQSLIENFRTANQKTGKLLDQYPAAQPILGYTGSRDLASFYKEAKRKEPDTTAVVCFSNIGIDKSYTKTLVYGEYYKPNMGLIKFYLVMKMELLQTKINGDSFSGIESEKMFQVY